MGRKAGGKNLGNFMEEKQSVQMTALESESLPEIFTCIEKDFISINDLIKDSGLSYDACAKIIREIKAVSDIFHISGYIHRTDYFVYLSRRFECGRVVLGGNNAN